ncbi:MAG TPA: hypothetical protein ENK70_02995 [Methylophaga sp.]|nr:hypothetical protein [Methylophaga sp.]
MKKYYVFEYLYRDANNFKAFGQVLVLGNITEDFIAEINSYLDFGEYFVAEQVNIPTLYSQLWKYSNGPTSADHAFHEFSLIRLATEQESAALDLWGAASDLLDTFRMASQQSWDCLQSIHCCTPLERSSISQDI